MALTAKKVYAILKRQISDMEAKLNSPVRYRGTVATADLLPLNPDIGDMYNIESKSVYGEAGMNVAWNGVVWDTMGAPIDMSLYFTKEEAEAVIQRLVAEYFEKNPVKPGATTEQAQQIEQNKTDIASLKTETNSLKEDISTKITKFYASNQGKAHLADSDNGKIMDMMLYGRSEQKQYSGKNLLNATLQTATWNGVTCTANGDGTYTLNGTATADSVFIIINNDDLKKAFGTNEELRLTGAPKGASRTGYYLQMWKNEPEVIYHDIGGGATVKKPNAKCNVAIMITKDTVCNNVLFKPMLTTNLTATYDDFEPYTGGISSPNPDYPQEIKSVVNPTVEVTNEDGLKVQSVTLNNITLNAIPVSSGGNVTIGGQQYIADYVDVERGKLVRCVKKLFLKQYQWSKAINKGVLRFYASTIDAVGIDGAKVIKNAFSISSHFAFVTSEPDRIGTFTANADGTNANIGFAFSTDTTTSSDDFNNWILNNKPFVLLPVLKEEFPLTSEQTQALKALATYYPTTNISVNSEQLDGYTVFNYPISMENGWNYVKQQIGDTREYIYDMDARTQDMDIQSAEAYVNSEYAVALTELEV